MFSRENLKIPKKRIIINTGHHTLVETWGNDWKTEWPTSSVFYGVRRYNAGVAPPAGKVLAYGGQAGYVRWYQGSTVAGQFGGQTQAGPCLLVGSRMVLVWTKCA